MRQRAGGVSTGVNARGVSRVSAAFAPALCALGLFVLVVFVVLSVTPSSSAQGPAVVINEIQPRNDTTVADGDGDFSDWIELRNLTAAPIDLAGWQIADSGASWTLPPGPETVIAANGFLLIWASDKEAAGPAGEIHTNFRLSGSSDSVTLTNNTFAVVDTVSYDMDFEVDTSFGRDATDNFVVFSPLDVTPREPNGAITQPTPTPTPTPVAPPGPASIVINEVMQSNEATRADGDGDFSDWLELYNPTCETVDVSGWTVRDSAESWPLPASTVLAPGDALLIWASDKGDMDDPGFPGPAGELHANFRLSSAGEDVFLVDGAGLLIATVNPGPTMDDESFALTSAGTYVIATGADVTPGVPNPGQVTCVPTPTPTPTPEVPTPTTTPTPTPTPTPEPATPTPEVPTPTPEPGTPTPTPEVPTPTPTPEVPTPTPTAEVPTPTPLPEVPTPTATAEVPTPTVVAPTTDICASGLVINEVQSRNDQTLADGDGDFSDWIELFNPNDQAVLLGTASIADSEATFLFSPDAVIGPGSYLLVWASDKGDPDDSDFPGPDDEIHANFRLSGSGETVTLSDAGAGCVIDQVAFPELDDDQSFGVTSSGGSGVFVVGFTTPGAANGAQGPTAARPACFAPNETVRIERLVARNDGLMFDGDGDDSDFIELKNTGFDPVNLTAWRISDESDIYHLPVGTVLGRGETILIWASGKGFVLDDDFPGPEGELHATFRLAGNGEQVTLAEPGGCIVDQVTYPELDDNQAFGFDEQGQRAILLPGITDAPCAVEGSVRIVAVQAKNDETLADEDGDFGDWIELRNQTDADLDLTGWVLSDDGETYVVPDGVLIKTGEDLLVWADEKARGGPDQPVHTNFRLGGDGETISLGSALSCPVDSVTYPELDDDQVYRLINDGEFAIQGGSTADDASDNDGKDDKSDDGDAAQASDVTIIATCIAINEIMAKNVSTIEDSDGEFGDWIELVNLSDEAIDLSGFEISDSEDGWTIPEGVEIEANGYLLLWADEGDRGGADDELHTNFKLSGDGEPVTVRDGDGDLVASLSTYPELDDDEAFGVDDGGDFVVRPVGDATPGDGPAPTSGCYFEVSAVASDDAESTATDGDTGDTGDDDPDRDDDDEGEGNASETAADADLARTGTSIQLPSVFAQFSLLGGLLLITMARIARRRSRF